ncbi:hypothetical protein DFH09DRAFT_1326110 [Mycena vulgaris]|nr:hypothetical protein DFH09DRAFT_1326110 [Mycena vulgaris]
MPPKSWTTGEQTTWLQSYVGRYMQSKALGDQIDFFVKLDEAWFLKWPAEATCLLPSRESGIVPTEEQTTQLATFLDQRKQQLRSWFRNHTKKARESGTKPVRKDDKQSILAALWKDSKRHRDPQLLELWIKKYPDTVKAALQDAGYNTPHAADIKWVERDGELPAESAKRKVKEQAAARMKMWRAVTQAAYEAQGEAVMKEMEADLARIKALKLDAKTMAKLTPELAKMSLEQLEGIIGQIHTLIMEKTGWVGFTMLGGPDPSAGGDLSCSVFSCGHSPAGLSFKESHPDWSTAVSDKFYSWLRRCFSRVDRDAMALSEADDVFDLLPVADDEGTESSATKSKPAPQKGTPGSKAPKRGRKNASPVFHPDQQVDAPAPGSFTTFSASAPTEHTASASSQPPSSHSTPVSSTVEALSPTSPPGGGTTATPPFFSFGPPHLTPPSFSFGPSRLTPPLFSFGSQPTLQSGASSPLNSDMQESKAPAAGAFSFSNTGPDPSAWFARPSSPLDPRTWSQLGGSEDFWASYEGATDPMVLPAGMGGAYPYDFVGGEMDMDAMNGGVDLADMGGGIDVGAMSGVGMVMEDANTGGMFGTQELVTTQPSSPAPLATPPPPPPLQPAAAPLAPQPRLTLLASGAPPRPPQVSTPPAVTPPAARPLPRPIARPRAGPPPPPPQLSPPRPSPMLVSVPRTSPLPPRIARASAIATIAFSSAALADAMKQAQKRAEAEAEADGEEDGGGGEADGDGASDGDRSEEEDVPLAGAEDFFPHSRPMANPPKPVKKSKGEGKAAENGRGRGGRGRGRGRGRGAGTVGRPRKTVPEVDDEPEVEAQEGVLVRGRGRGHGAGANPVGRPRKTVPEEGDNQQEGGAAVDAGGASEGRTRRKRVPLTFYQTYGDNGEIIPLPLDSAPPEMHGRRWSGGEKKGKGAAARKPDLRNWAGPSDLVVLPHLQGAPIPPVPETGRPGRARRPPKNANDDLELLEALKDKAGGKRVGEHEMNSTKKRKVTDEEEEGGRKKRKR